MKANLAGALLVAIAIASVASAQTPAPRPDVRLSSTAGVYPIACVTPADLDLAEICWVRVDVGGLSIIDGAPLELGCMATTGPDKRHELELAVARTLNVDAVVKCYVRDVDGNVGNLSANSGLIDFTRPGAPHVVSGGPIARAWPPRPERDLVLELEALHARVATSHLDQPLAFYTPRERARRGLKHLVLEIED